MADDTQPTKTLRQALIDEGSDDQVALLTEKTGNLKPEDFIRYVNNITLEDLTSDEKHILRTIAVMRVQRGQPLFPWTDAAFLNEMKAKLGEGFVY
jgi:hypothetical protein